MIIIWVNFKIFLKKILNKIERPPKQEEEGEEKPKPKRGGFHRITKEGIEKFEIIYFFRNF